MDTPSNTPRPTNPAPEGDAAAGPTPTSRGRGRSFRRRALIACAAGGLVLVGAVGGFSASALSSASSAASAVSSGGGTVQVLTPDGGSDSASPYLEDPGSSSTDDTTDAKAATDAESTGVVIIETELGYYDAEAAGTGIVLTSDGRILTNNHVIEGSTSISVTIASTGKTYEATVVGTDSTEDVAVLQLQGASGLATATIDDDDDLAVGDAVTAVGNADGGGELLAADGTVTDLDATITTQAEGVVSSETLENLIEVDADVVSGDSGGALLDEEGEVVGMTTAASSGTSDITGYAIDIDEALSVAEDIVNGTETDTNTIGYPAFLGVTLSSDAGSQAETETQGTDTRGPSSFFGEDSDRSYDGTDGTDDSGSSTGSGATVSGVLDGTPAADAGLVAGDTITAVDGQSVADADALSDILSGYAPGDQVSITWTDADGASHTATVTLIEGPAD